MPIDLTYLHTASGEPRPLTPQQIWALAGKVRRQILDDPTTRRIDIDELVERAGEFVINGIAFSAWWDLDHVVTADRDRQVMGSTHFDPASPDGVMVSINGQKLRGRDDLMRSTIAHELGHVIFDVPSWIRAANVASATWDPATEPWEEPLASALAPLRRDKRGVGEFRANEHMGGLVTPPAQLKVDFLRLAKRYRLPTSPKPSQMLRGAPAFDGWACDPDAVADALFSLGERYGTSESFVRVRLDRYDLLRTRRMCDVV